MGFVPKGGRIARDFQKGITIASITRFEDLGPDDAFPYSYSQGNLKFEFRAMAYSDWRIFTSYTKTELRKMHVATYIVEHLSSDWIQWKGAPLTFGAYIQSVYGEGYPELKQNIRDGMLALDTHGGQHFRFVPDFRVEFVRTEVELPKPPPRPSNLNNVIAATMSEEPIKLGANKNIAFVYEDFGAHDPEKGVTVMRIYKFEEISLRDPMPYVYSQGDLTFEFRASKYREWRLKLDTNADGLLRPFTATYVIEDSIKQGMAKANCRPLTAIEYKELRQNIKDSLWVIETSNGQWLRHVPEFRIEFVNSASEVPEWPPRPST